MSAFFLCFSGDTEARRWRWECRAPSQWAQGPEEGQPWCWWAPGVGAPAEPQALGTEPQEHFIGPRQPLRAGELRAEPRAARGRAQWEVRAGAKGCSFLQPLLCSLHFINMIGFSFSSSFHENKNEKNESVFRVQTAAQKINGFVGDWICRLSSLAPSVLSKWTQTTWDQAFGMGTNSA